MPDQPQDVLAGPDLILSTQHAPTRSQLASIAHLAGQLLDFPLETRLDATIALTRLQMAVTAHQRRAPLPEPAAF